MSTQWFECKVRHDKTMEDGLIKSVTESFLVDALSFTEAESRFIDEIKQFITGEFTVTDIKRTRIAELYESNDSLADRWYRGKISQIIIDDKSEKEKRTSYTVLVQAIDLRDAVKNIDAAMANSITDYDIVSVTETKIIDVYRYKQKE